MYDLTRADEPVEAGTPLNKASLLTDETAKKLGLTPDATVNDALAAAADSGGGLGTSINLLEVVENMKYCKILTHEQPNSEIASYLSNSVFQTGYESDDGKIHAVACMDAYNSSQLKIRTINYTAGKTYDYAVDLGADFYGATTANLSSRGSGTYGLFSGWFHFAPVKNKPNEIMLKFDGVFQRMGKGSSAAYGYSGAVRLVYIVDTTTGATKVCFRMYYAASVTNAATSSNAWPALAQQDFCYYNSTYGYYYTPLTYTNTSAGNNKKIVALKSGCNFLGSGNGNIQTTADYAPMSVGHNGYIGAVPSSNSYPTGGAAWAIPVSDTQWLYVMHDCRGILRVYTQPMTAYNTIGSAVQLYYSDSMYTITSAEWGSGDTNEISWYVLTTASNQVYLFCVGSLSQSVPGYDTSTATAGIVRIGPMSTSTSSSNVPERALIASGTNPRVFNMLGCVNRDPDKLLYCNLLYDAGLRGGYQGRVFALVSDADGVTRSLMLPTVMRGWMPDDANVNADIRYRYDGINNPWTRGYTLPTCWYNESLTKMFYCAMDRTVYLGDMVQAVSNDIDGEWECPEDGIYKFILVGGGAAGSGTYGGGSGYLKVVTKQCVAGEKVPYHIGWGGLVVDSVTNPYAVEPGSSLTWAGDKNTFALGGSASRGGSNGYPSLDGGGGGGYDLVEYGGNGQPDARVPNRNGGQGSMPASGYGAGGCVNQNGQDGCIVIIR